jgi:probable F420-dependent oxidoreductase
VPETHTHSRDGNPLADSTLASVKFGLYGLHKGENTAPEALARRARAAEDAGFESIWVGDHIALPPDAPDDAYDARLEALVMLAHLAAITRRVRLAVGVIVLPQRQPVLLAKQLTSIDVLSDGRLIVGLGVGYLEAELRALGTPLAARGARTDEYIAALRVLWDEPMPDYHGRFVSFSNVIQRPRPAQRPHPPIVIGGESPAAYRRARSADGWYGWERSPQQVAAVREEIGPELEVTITPSPPGPIPLELARRYADVGVDRLVLQPPDTTGASMDELIVATRNTLIGRV